MVVVLVVVGAVDFVVVFGAVVIVCGVGLVIAVVGIRAVVADATTKMRRKGGGRRGCILLRE